MSEPANDSIQSPLVTAMNTLSLILDGIPESEKRMYCNNSEGIYFEVDQITQPELINKVKQAGFTISPIVYRNSRIDGNPERDYVIFGVSIPLKNAEFRSGISVTASTFIMNLEKEDPSELLFVAIETPPSTILIIDIVDEDVENDTVEILLSESLEIFSSLN